MRSDRIPWETPHRRLSPGTPLARGLIFVLFGLGLAQDELLRGEVGLVAGLVLGLIAAGLAYGAVGWWLTKWWLTPYELRIDAGVLRRTSRRIRIDRIQEIDLVKPLGARLLGLSEVRLDVAGSQDSDSLAFLGGADAAELKEALLARRELAPTGTPTHQGVEVTPGAVVPHPHGSDGPRPAEVELARVPLTRQIAVQAASHAAIGLLVLTPVWAWAAGGPDGRRLLAAVTVPLIGALALVVMRDLSENWGFVLTEDHLGLHVRRGLVNVSHQTIATHRLQGLKITEPLLWRAAGWARLDVATAGALGVGAAGPDASTVLSVGGRDEVYALASRLLARDVEAISMSAPPVRAHLLSPLVARTFGFSVDEALVASRAGWWVRRTQVVPHGRVQSVRMTQGPLQRRLALATVRVDSPEGPVRVTARHRPVAQARTLLDAEVAASRTARLDALPRG
ncbi:PH domain-containing protein [Nocardioidaceae bacterium]|nr:PH domain-containing protein [Nocardioidaceae bacterium]